MKVNNLFLDIKSILEQDVSKSDYTIAFASYVGGDSSNISVTDVEAVHWDEEDFFLIPAGSAQHYDIEGEELTVRDFLLKLKDAPLSVINDLAVYAHTKIKLLPDGSIASITSPLWGTGVHDDARLVYFYCGDEPDAS